MVKSAEKALSCVMHFANHSEKSVMFKWGDSSLRHIAGTLNTIATENNSISFCCFIKYFPDTTEAWQVPDPICLHHWSNSCNPMGDL